MSGFGWGWVLGLRGGLQQCCAMQQRCRACLTRAPPCFCPWCRHKKEKRRRSRSPSRPRQHPSGQDQEAGANAKAQLHPPPPAAAVEAAAAEAEAGGEESLEGYNPDAYDWDSFLGV